MARLNRDEVNLVERAVAFCAGEDHDMLSGRKFMKKLLALIEKEQKGGLPTYSIVTGLWVTLYSLAEEWKRTNE